MLAEAMDEGNPDRRRVPSAAAARWLQAVTAGLWAIAGGAALARQVSLGRSPSEADLLVAAGGPLGWLTAPLALAVHGSATHLAVNGLTIGVAAWTWVSLGRLDRPSGGVGCARGLRALALSVLTGAGALALSATLDGGARVGASGAFHGLLGALASGLALRALRIPPEDASRRRAMWRGALLCLALPLFIWLGLRLGTGGRGVDHLSHGLGLGLGLVLGPLAEREASSWPLAAGAALWCGLAGLA
jgi:hypothetical protein